MTKIRYLLPSRSRSLSKTIHQKKAPLRKLAISGTKSNEIKAQPTTARLGSLFPKDELIGIQIFLKYF